jgi:hypothetical protein
MAHASRQRAAGLDQSAEQSQDALQRFFPCADNIARFTAFRRFAASDRRQDLVEHEVFSTAFFIDRIMLCPITPFKQLLTAKRDCRAAQM